MQEPALYRDKDAGQRWPVWLSSVAVLTVLGLVQLNLWVWHPGFRSMDEFGELARIQVADEGEWPTLYFGGHGWSALAHLAVLHLLGPWALQARLLSGVALAFEAFFLFQLCRRYWNTLAGVGAVLALCANAYTLARTRTLYSFQFTPAVILGLAYFLPLARKPRQAVLWGMAAGLCLADYEALALAMPALGLLWLSSERSERPRLPGLLAGLALGLGIVAWQTLPLLTNYLAQRTHEAGAAQGSSLWNNLRQTFFGGDAEDWLLGRPAAWPLWLWPGLLVGLVLCARPERPTGPGEKLALRLPKGWIFALILCGFLPMALYSGRTETNRSLAAWPGLLLAAGAGTGFLVERFRSAWGSFGLSFALSLCLLGFMRQVALYQREAARSDFDCYEYSRRLEAARQFLAQRAAHASLRLLTQLNYRDMGEARYFFRGLSSPQGKETWVLLFDEQLPPGPKPAWGEWQEFRARADGRALLLLKPKAGTEERFVRAQAETLAAIGPILRVVERVQSTTAYLLSDKPKDPLAASIALDGYLRAQELLRWQDPHWPATFEKLKPGTTRQRLWMAGVWEPRDPLKARALLQEALRLDPQRDSVQRANADFFARHPSFDKRGHP